MTRKWLIVGNAAALVGAVLFVVSAMAQPPRFDKKKDAPKDAPKADPDVDAWVKVLTAKLTDKNEAVRSSARAALVSVGPAALPALKKLADGDDKAAADAAKGVIAQISEEPRRGGGRGGDNPPERGGGRGFGGAGLFDRVTRDLDLTDKQKDKVKDIVSAQEKKMRDAMEKARDGGRPDFQKIRDTMKSMHEDLVKDLKPVLTPEQLKKVEKNLENGIGGFGGGFGGFRGQGGPGGRGPGGPGARGTPPDSPRRPDTTEVRRGPFFLAGALKDLDLSEKQKAKAADIADKHDKKVQAMLDKAAEAKERPDFAEIGKLLADSMKDLKTVLSDEQFQKLEKSVTQGGTNPQRGPDQGSPRRREF